MAGTVPKTVPTHAGFQAQLRTPIFSLMRQATAGVALEVVVKNPHIAFQIGFPS